MAARTLLPILRDAASRLRMRSCRGARSNFASVGMAGKPALHAAFPRDLSRGYAEAGTRRNTLLVRKLRNIAAAAPLSFLEPGKSPRSNDDERCTRCRLSLRKFRRRHRGIQPSRRGKRLQAAHVRKCHRRFTSPANHRGLRNCRARCRMNCRCADRRGRPRRTLRPTGRNKRHKGPCKNSLKPAPECVMNKCACNPLRE